MFSQKVFRSLEPGKWQAIPTTAMAEEAVFFLIVSFPPE
jgi:hypothetical protein